jgi:hypothetical protein
MNIRKFIIVVMLLGFHFVSGISVINRLSPTYDEPLHLAAGYSYLRTGKYYLNIYDHPPLAEKFAALPLLAMKPVLPLHLSSWENYEQYSFADSFLYNNRVDAEKMLTAGRVMILLLSCALGFFVFLWTLKVAGGGAALFALALYTLFPGFIANGTLVTTDMVLTLFMFASFYFLHEWLGKKDMLNAALAGVCAGLAMCSKFSAPIIFPIALVVLFLARGGEKTAPPWWDCKKPAKVKISAAGLIAISVACAALVVLAVYGPGQIGLYFDGINAMMRSMQRGRSSFLFGGYSTSGWRHYFAAVFILKTPLALVLLCAVSLFCLKGAPVRTKVSLIVPPLLYFAAASFSKVQIGFRHILPVYPFIIVLCGVAFRGLSARPAGRSGAPFRQLADGKVRRGGRSRAALALLILWIGVSFATVHPWHISYFNEAAGGSASGYRLLTDSNNDWGQGLKELSKKYKLLFLCYFGTGDPHYYGIKYEPVGFINNLKPEERRGDLLEFGTGDRVYFAVSATNYQATYYADKKIFSFLWGYKPEVVAYSILVFDLTGKPEALAGLAGVYTAGGNRRGAATLLDLASAAGRRGK